MTIIRKKINKGKCETSFFGARGELMGVYPFKYSKAMEQCSRCNHKEHCCKEAPCIDCQSYPLRMTHTGRQYFSPALARFS